MSTNIRTTRYTIAIAVTAALCAGVALAQDSTVEPAKGVVSSKPETARDDQTSAPETARDPPASGPETARDDQTSPSQSETSTPQTGARHHIIRREASTSAPTAPESHRSAAATVGSSSRR